MIKIAQLRTENHSLREELERVKQVDLTIEDEPALSTASTTSPKLEYKAHGPTYAGVEADGISFPRQVNVYRVTYWTHLMAPVFAKLGEEFPSGHQLNSLRDHFRKAFLVPVGPEGAKVGRGQRYTVPEEEREEFLKALEAYVTSPKWAA
ncbi:hypothetical protein HK104_008378 [Borealophlyctis nickersoniae]|nr:hypothetical protein HK104_008378 [Borealophlyctis nickersoniae]